MPVVVDSQTTIALSPDGRYVAFVLTTDEVQQIWLHAFETKRTRPVRGTEGSRGLFWAPSSRQIAFFAGGALKRVSIEGDGVQQICETPTSFNVGTWGAGDTIIFYDSVRNELVRGPATGGTPQPLAASPGNSGWPTLLPDGRRFLLGTSNGIFQGSLETTHLTRVIDVPSLVTYTSTRHILYESDAALAARPFDPATGRVVGEPRVLAEGLQYFAPTGGASFSSADVGAVAYLRSNVLARRLAWIARDGRDLGSVAPDAPWGLRLASRQTARAWRSPGRFRQRVQRICGCTTCPLVRRRSSRATSSWTTGSTGFRMGER